MEEKIPFEAGPPCMGADAVEGAYRERPEAAKKFAETVVELVLRLSATKAVGV